MTVGNLLFTPGAHAEMTRFAHALGTPHVHTVGVSGEGVTRGVWDARTGGDADRLARALMEVVDVRARYGTYLVTDMEPVVVCVGDWELLAESAAFVQLFAAIRAAEQADTPVNLRIYAAAHPETLPPALAGWFSPAPSRTLADVA